MEAHPVLPQLPVQIRHNLLHEFRTRSLTPTHAERLIERLNACRFRINPGPNGRMFAYCLGREGDWNLARDDSYEMFPSGDFGSIGDALPLSMDVDTNEHSQHTDPTLSES